MTTENVKIEAAMPSARHYFEDRHLVIATKHRKEAVITPLVNGSLGVISQIAEGFDTDVLGTFTGEIERKDDALTTLRNKCLMAMALSGCDLGVGSEGSFGPHPTLFFTHADDELVMLIDQKNGLEIVARELTTETNFNAAFIHSKAQLKAFAKEAMFPSHALILRDHKDSHKQVFKGITDADALWSSYQYLMTHFGTVYAETDMRAMHNPTRMKVIERATRKLLEKINSCCPQCHTPGFGITQAKPGLPCQLCHGPTDSTLSHVYTCSKCKHPAESKFPHGKTSEDPMYCNNCNP